MVHQRELTEKMDDKSKRKKLILNTVGIATLIVIGWMIYREYVFMECTRYVLGRTPTYQEPERAERVRDLCVDAGGVKYTYFEHM